MDPVQPHAPISIANVASAIYAINPPTYVATPVKPTGLASCQTGGSRTSTTTQGFDGDGLPKDLMDTSRNFVPFQEDIAFVSTRLSQGGGLPKSFQLYIARVRRKGNTSADS